MDQGQEKKNPGERMEVQKGKSRSWPGQMIDSCDFPEDYPRLCKPM